MSRRFSERERERRCNTRYLPALLFVRGSVEGSFPMRSKGLVARNGDFNSRCFGRKGGISRDTVCVTRARVRARCGVSVLDDVAPTSTSFYDLRAVRQTLRFTLYTTALCPRNSIRPETYRGGGLERGRARGARDAERLIELFTLTHVAMVSRKCSHG